MTTVVLDLPELAAVLRDLKPKRVGIDGVDGVGKSHLSLAVASELNAAVIEIDEFIEENQGGYVAFVDYPRVAARIAESQAFVLEGVCLLEVTERLGVDLDCLIYVKRMSKGGLWADESECEFPFGIEEAIRQSQRDTEVMLEFIARQEGRPYTPGAAREPGLGEEIMRYHAKRRPHAVADITFCRHAG